MNDYDAPEAPPMERRPVWSNEAEQSVLGALLVEPDAADRITLTAAEFHHAAHRVIFAAIQREIAARRPVDVVSVFLALQAQGADAEAGGLPYLNALAQSVVSARPIKRHADIVAEHAKCRAVMSAADEAAEIATSAGTAAEKTERIASLFGALQRGQVQSLPRSIYEIALERTQHYEDLEAGRIEAGWPTRIPTLDAMLSGGLRPGKLYILAARPKVGKSSLAQTVALTMARAGRPTLFLSQEMGAEEVADRAVVNVGRLSYSAMVSGKMEPDDWSRASDALTELSDAKLFVDDQGGLRLSDIKAKARTVPGLKVLVLDYLQLSASDLKDSNRNTQIEELSRGLKTMAKQMGLCVIALSQLNREVEKRASKRPQLSDLRDSGAIEQDADAVMFLWPVRELDEGRRLVGMSVEANRQGRCGLFGLEFHGSTQRWGESMLSVEPQAAATTKTRFE